MKNIFLAVIVMALCATSINAAEFDSYNYNGNGNGNTHNTPVNYNFAEIRIGQFTIDDVPATYEDSGLYLAGGGESMINENLIFSFMYEGAVLSDTYWTISSETLAAGLLYRAPMNEKTDFLIGGYLVYGWTEIDVPISNFNLTDNDTGLAASVGIRHGIDEKNEIGVQVIYVDLFNDSATTVSANYMHYTSGKFGIGAGFGSSSDMTTVALTMKWKTK